MAVEGDLGVEGEHAVVLEDDERVHLEERGVELDEGLVDEREQLGGVLGRRAREPEAVGEVARLVAGEPDDGVDDLLEDLLGRLGGDLLDLHAALGRGHDDDAPGAAVDDDAQIELARDVHTLLDEEALDDLARGPRLVRHELHAEDLLRRLARGGRALDDLDAPALAAATGVDLGLDDHHLAARLGDERLGGGLGLVDAEGGRPLGHGHAVLPQQLFPLILVDFHGCVGLS